MKERRQYDPGRPTLHSVLAEAREEIIKRDAAIKELKLKVDQQREICAAMLELSSQDLTLMAGEMTAQELRTVKAVLKALQSSMRFERV